MDMHACGFVFTGFFTLHCIVKTGVKAHSLWSVAPQLLLVLPISTAPAQSCSSTIIGVAYKYCSSAKIRRLLFASMKPTTSSGI
jgi:hypothetical protein